MQQLGNGLLVISIYSSFSWDLEWSQEKTKAMLMQNLGGQTKSIMVFSEVAYFVQLCQPFKKADCDVRHYTRFSALRSSWMCLLLVLTISTDRLSRSNGCGYTVLLSFLWLRVVFWLIFDTRKRLLPYSTAFTISFLILLREDSW